MKIALWIWTPGERLWLARRASGESLGTFAARFRIGRNLYHKFEKDEIERRRLHVARPRPAEGDLAALARRRSGLGLAGTARAAGVSRVTVLAWEEACDPRIVNFWRKRGFRFPK